MAGFIARRIPNGAALSWGFGSVGYLLGWTVVQLVLNVLGDLGPLPGSEFAFHAAQSDTNYIPVMQLAAEILAKLEP